MNSKVIPVLVFVMVAVMAVPVMMRLGMGEKPEPVTLAELDAGMGRVIRITIEANTQQTLSLHYHVMVDGQPTVEHAFFGTLPRTSPPPGFVLHTAESGNLVGVAQASYPDRIIILHDFTNNDSWPMRIVNYKDTDPQHLYPYYEEADSITTRGEALFARLVKDNVDKSLELLDTLGMRPLSIPTVQAETGNPDAK
ncbi:MAG: hypothetical protein R3C45_19935 [Phycisphaerales bacterium]